MFVAFNELPPEARVWIYQASRPFFAAELAAALPELVRFADDWTSHGRAVRASAEIRHQQFLIIGLDEAVAGASGCSIDASVRLVAQLEQFFGLELLDKSALAFLQAGAVQLLKRSNLKAAIAAGTVTSETFYFDNTVATKEALEREWPRPAAATWLARHFPKVEKTGI